METQIPAFFHITDAAVHDSKAMKEIPYEPGSYYIFDRAYNSFKMLYRINQIEAYLVVRAKKNLQYKSTQTPKECAFRYDNRIDWLLSQTILFRTASSCEILGRRTETGICISDQCDAYCRSSGSRTLQEPLASRIVFQMAETAP